MPHPDPLPPASPAAASPPPSDLSKIERKVEHLASRYLRLATPRPGLLLLCFLVIAGLCVKPVIELLAELHTDMAELLPDEHPSVVALRRVTPRQISSTNLVVILESPDAAANRRYAEALRPALNKLIGTTFSEIQWKPETEVPAFAHRSRFLYAPLEDLASAEVLLDRIIAKRKSPLWVDLEGDPEKELTDLRTRLNQKLPATPTQEYFEFPVPNTNMHHLGIMLWRRSDGMATLGDQQTIDAVQALITQIAPSGFHPQMRVEFSGAIAMALAEQRAVRDDLSLATGVCVTLVLLSIYLYYRRIGVLLGVGAPAVFGVLLSLAVARHTVHFLNANSAFLISIILGNGINSPIVLFARYGEERGQGRSVADSLRIAMAATFLGTLTAMAAASIAYGSLMVTTLRGLSQFGFIGGIGMLLVWLVTFLLLPPLVLFVERYFPGRMTPGKNLLRRPFGFLGQLAQRFPKALTAAWVLSLCVLALPAYRYAKEPLEYDPNALRSDDPEGARLWGAMYDLGLGNVGAGYIARDGVILVDSPEQADAVADALLAQDRALGPDKYVIEAVRTLNKILPTDQPKKLEILARIRQKIDKHRELMDDAEQQEINAWRPADDLRVLGVPDLPRRLRENFTEVDGTIGRFVGIDADPARYKDNDGRDIIRLSRSMRVEHFGKTWIAAAASTLFAGMLETIIADGPTVTYCALLGVTLLLLVMFGVRRSLIVIAALAVGLLWLVGMLGVFKWKLNFLNFAALPITIGVGADYAANMWARIRHDGPEHIGTIVGETGSAVFLCSLTTIIGYSSLLLSRSRALQSFGRLANLGEITCLFAALIVLPTLVLIAARRKR